MTVVKTRWLCSECDDVCEKRPFFNFYIPGKKNAINFYGPKPPGAELLCVNCKHPANKHSFTFLEPKAKREQK